jgi:hypothetical protein
MIYVVVIVGFAILSFQIAAGRLPAVHNNKALRMALKILEQLDGIDTTHIAADAQAEIDQLAGKFD